MSETPASDLRLRRADLPWLVALTLAYVLLTKLGVTYLWFITQGSLVWLPNGLALAALLVGGRKYWPAIFLGALLGLWWAGCPPELSRAQVLTGNLGGALGKTLGPFLVVGWLRHVPRFDAALNHARDYWWLFLLGTAGGLVNATLGGGTLWLAEVNELPITLGAKILNFWLGDVFAVVLFVPLLLVWRHWPGPELLDGKRVEAAVALGLAGLTGQVVFVGWQSDWLGDLPLGYLAYAFVLWGGVRFGRHGALLLIVLFAVQGLSGAARGVGVFGHQQAIAIWFFLLILSAIGITVSLLFHAGERAEAAQSAANAALKEANEKLRAENVARLVAETAQHETERRAREMLEGVQLAVVMLDADGRVTFCNDTLLRLTGWTRGEALGRDWFACFLPPGSDAVRERYFEAVRRREPPPHWQGYETTIVTKTGEPRLFRWSSLLQHAADGAVIGVSSVGEDITERQRATAERAQFLADSEAARVTLLSLTEDSELSAASLRRSNLLLEASQATAKVGGWELDLGTGQLFWTAETYRLHDTSPEAFDPTVDDAIGYFSPESRPIISAALQAATERGEGYDLVLEILTAKGRRIDVRATCEVTLHEGRPAKLTGIFQDITERKEAEIALRDSEEQYRALFDFSPVPLALNDAAQNIVRVNAAFVITFGYTLADIPTLADWWPKACPDPEYRRWVSATWEERLALAAQNGTGFEELELKIRCRDGTDRMVMAGAADLGTTMAGLRMIVFYDITARKAAEDALQASRRQLEAEHGQLQEAVEIAHLVWWEWNLKTGRVRVDTGGVDECVMGFEPSLTLPASQAEWLANTADEDRAGVEAGLDRVKRGEAPEWSAEYRARFASGDYRWVRLIGRVTRRDGDGVVHLMTGTLQDVHAAHVEATRKADLELMLRQAQKMGMLGQFAAGVAHDFNNLLTGIGGHIQLAQLELEPTARAAASLQIAQRGCDRSRDLVVRLMQFARGEQQTSRAPTDLERLVRETAPLIIAAISRRVSLKLAVQACPPIMADEGQIMQVLMNLSLNGAHACGPKGGVVTITLAPVRDGGQPGGAVCLAVTDNGCGMDEATLARIFEAFFTTKPVGQGTGLGMAVVRGIVEAHGGQIGVESRPGLGTTVKIVLPTEAVASVDRRLGDRRLGDRRAGDRRDATVKIVLPTEAVAVPAAGPSAGSGRIIVVDDDEMIVSLLTAAFKKDGYTVNGYPGAEPALAAVRAGQVPVDLVVTDLAMPGGSGIDLIAALRELKPGLPALLMSGNFDHEKARLATLVGVVKMPKPFDLRELKETVARLLDPK